MNRFRIPTALIIVLSLVMAIVPTFALAAEAPGITLTYWVPIDGGTTTLQYIQSYAENTAYIERELRTGVHIEWIHPAVGQEREQFNLLIASGDLPDIIGRTEYYAGGPAAGVQDGVFADITDLLDEYAPNITHLMALNPDYARECYSDDGIFTGFSIVSCYWDEEVGDFVPGRAFPPSGPVMRADMLKEIGMDAPETMSEWYQVLTAIKEQINPKIVLDWSSYGNGRDTFVGAYGVGADFIQRDGTVYYSPMEDGFRDWLAEMAKWYEEGLIDPEFATRDKDSINALINSGDVAACVIQPTAFNTTQLANYGFEWSGTVFPTLEKGEEAPWRLSEDLVRGHHAMISADSKHIKEAIEWLDWGYSVEGMYLMCCGVLGQDYTEVLDDGRVVYTDELTADGNYWYSQKVNVFRINSGSNGKLSPIVFNPAYDAKEMRDLIDLREGSTEYVLPAVYYTAEESAELAAIMADVETYTNEMRLKFIMGIESLDQWDGYVSTIENMGIADAIRITQQATDRYYAR